MTTYDMAALLQEAVTHLKLGETVEEILSRWEWQQLSPADQQEMRSLLGTASQLMRLGRLAVPAPQKKVANRAGFLGEAFRLKSESERAPARSSVADTLRGWIALLPTLRMPAQLGRAAISAALVVVLLLAAAGGAVRVSAGSLPGSALYPLKLAVEDTRLLVTSSRPGRARLYLRFVEERTEEMLRLSAAGRPVDEAVLERMTRQFQAAVQTAATVAEYDDVTLGAELLQQAMATGAQQERILLQASAQAPAPTRPALAAGAAVARETAYQAEQALSSLGVVPVPATPTPGATASAAMPVASATALPVPSATVPAAPSATAVPGAASPTDVPVTATLPAESATAAATLTAAPQPTGTPTALPEPTRTLTPTRTATRTPTRTRTSTRTRTPTRTATLTRTPTLTRTLTLTPTVTPTLTQTPTATVTSTLTPTATGTPPTPTPTASPTPLDFRVYLYDQPDPVPASYRIHYTACVANNSAVTLTQASLVVSWSPADCAFLPSGNSNAVTFTIGTLSPGASRCETFDLDTSLSLDCLGAIVRAEAVLTCDQGTARAQTTTLIGPVPTPTPTITPTPQTNLGLVMGDHPDPVPAGHTIHYDICVRNYSDTALTHVVIVDNWSPRDCVYFAPDNPAEARWELGTLNAHSERCVQLDLNTFVICAGNVVTNQAVVTCDQGSASAQTTTTIGPAPTPTPTLTFTPTSTPLPTATDTPVPTATPTPVPTATMTPAPPTEPPTATSLSTEEMVPTSTLTQASP